VQDREGDLLVGQECVEILSGREALDPRGVI